MDPTSSPSVASGAAADATFAPPTGIATTPPATETVVDGGAASQPLGATLAGMKAAARKSGAPGYEDRIRSLERLERALLGRKAAIAEAICRDFGNRSKHESLIAEVFMVVSAIKYAKSHLRDWMEIGEREVDFVFLPASIEVRPQPVGVVGIISPWNYPVQLAFSPLVGALAAGNRAMLKPSELVPETAALLRDLVAATFPPDEVTVALGGPELAEEFSRLPFDHLVFTGSTRVGKLVMKAAAENLVPVTLELGGKSPTIVGPDFSTQTAADRIMAGKLFNAGQTCIAPDYALVPAGLRDAFVDACKRAVTKMYPTLVNNPDYTSIVSDKHHARLRGYLEDAKTRGARLVELNPASEDFGAAMASRKLAPTLVLDPSEGMLVLSEEIFGPILPVKTYETLDEAVAYVNDHPRPLALYFFSHDKAAVDRVLSDTLSGGVTINETMLHVAQDDLPFGGIGASGMGAYHAKEGFDAFTKNKPVFRQARVNTTGLLRAPYGKTLDALLKFMLG